MTNRIILTIATMLVLAALTVLVIAPRISPVQASAPDQSGSLQAATDPNAGILVSGEGHASAKPNIAQASIGIEITAPNLSDALSQSNAKMNAVIDKIKSLGVADKDVQTVDYSVMPLTNQPKPDGTSVPGITGYRVSNQVRVTIRKIEDVGKVLDQTLAAGANRIYGVSFSVDDTSVFEGQARAAAIKDAQDKAAQLAKNAGIQLGPILSISEGTSLPRPAFARSDMSLAAGGAPVETGQLDVIVDVQIRFGIK